MSAHFHTHTACFQPWLLLSGLPSLQMGLSVSSDPISFVKATSLMLLPSGIFAPQLLPLGLVVPSLHLSCSTGV